MGVIDELLRLITELTNKSTSCFFKLYVHTDGLTKQAKKVLSIRFRFWGTKRQRRKHKGRKELLIIVRDIGEALPKVQEPKSYKTMHSNKNPSEEVPDRVDEWLSALSNVLDKRQDDPTAANLEDYTATEVSKHVPFSLNESRIDFCSDSVSLPGSILSDKENTIVGYLDPVQIKSTFDLLGSLKEVQEFKHCKISPLNDIGFFTFKFPTEDQKTLALEHGQLFINNKPLILKRWSPKIILVPTLFLSALPIWVRFYNLNWAYWSQECLSRICSIIGNPLFMDKCTSTMARLDYARVCVEVNTDVLHFPDIVHMLRNGKIIPVSVKYEWKPQQCVLCLSIYHDSDECEFLVGGEFVFSASKLKLHQQGRVARGTPLRSSYCDNESVETISVGSGPQVVESSIGESMDDALQGRMMFLE